MHRLGLVAVLSGVVFGLAPAGHARPEKISLVDCACYDILRVAPGRAPQTIFRNTGQNLYDVSRDRRHVVYAGIRGRLYVARLNGSRRRLLDKRRSHWAVFAPDGARVAYGVDGCRLCIARVDGRGRRRYPVAGARGPVAWSPDSRRLAFVVSHASAAADKGILSVAQLDGRGIRRLLRGRYFQGRSNLGVKMAWSPRGGRLAYLAGARTRVHVLRLRDARLLASVRGRAPVWSPNGERLAYSNGFRIAVMRYDGTRRHVLDRYSVDPYGSGTSWSPGGRWIAFSRYSTHDRYQLTIARFDGRSHRVLSTESDDVEIGPTYWARRGATVFYTVFRQHVVTGATARFPR